MLKALCKAFGNGLINNMMKKAPSSKKKKHAHDLSLFKTRVQNRNPMSDQNGQNQYSTSNKTAAKDTNL